MNAMTQEIRDLVREYLDLANLSQKVVAARGGKRKDQVSRALRGDIGKLSTVWESILDVVGLKLVVVPKDADIDVKALIREAALKARDNPVRVQPRKGQ